jgi:CheY-like chemotaxis protein
MLETETIDLAGGSTDPDAQSRPAVLVVDGDLHARNFYADYLTQMGCPVVAAYDGWEATARLKRSPRTRHIPVIVMSDRRVQP